MADNSIELSDTINQTYNYQTKGKTPTEVQHELRNLGVKGFIVGMTSRKVKMKVKREDIKTNRECLRWILIIYYYNNFINIPVITAHVPKKEKMKISIHLIQKSFTE